MVTVDWLAPTFDRADFEMCYTTSPTAAYDVQPLGDPQVTTFVDAVVIGQDLAISNAPGVPDGTVHQEMIVSLHPDQPTYAPSFEYVEALLPGWGGNGVGFSLAFGVAGGEFDPDHPLLEVFTTAD